MKKIRVVSLLLLISMLTCGGTTADEVQTSKIEYCGSCHGAVGISIYDLWPNIAGQKKPYLANQLQRFRNGERFDPWMSPIAGILSDGEIEELADFYSKLVVK